MVMQRLTGALGGILGGGGQKQTRKPGYPSLITIASGDAAFNTAAEVIALLPAAGAKARIWEMTIPGGGWLYRWGAGSPVTPDNQGYWWFALLDAGTGFASGIVTLAYESYDRHTYIPIVETHDALLHSVTNTSLATAALIDKKQMQALPEGGPLGNPAFVQQYSRLVIDYKCIARATAEDVADFNIPVTIYS